MSIFSAETIWDPREPTPPRYPEAIGLSTVVTPTQRGTVLEAHVSGVPSGCIDLLRPPVYRRLLPSTVIEESDRNVLPAV
ncbi:hypothetical protein F4679DRAFT_525363 [Xylaria curta]|nr:hypothetical protein F4679DRAFT_525363 [Xylaria curta]